MTSPSHQEPSPKRLRSTSSAIRFDISPKFMNKVQALEANRKDHPGGVELRFIDRPLTAEQQAESLPWCSPINNKGTLSRFQALENRFNLYNYFVGSSAMACSADLITFLLRVMDHHLRRIVHESMEDSPLFLENFVSAQGRPFQTTTGANIRYITLLRFADKLKKASNRESEGDLRLSEYEKLLCETEVSMLKTLRSLGAQKLDDTEVDEEFIERIRAEALDFVTAGHRDIASHIFSDLLWTDYRSNIKDHEFKDADFSRIRHDAFDLSRPLLLENMAVKSLVLNDLNQQLKEGRIGQHIEKMTACASFLVEKLIAKNVSQSRRVKCGSMEAVLPGGAQGSQEPLILDRPCP